MSLWLTIQGAKWKSPAVLLQCLVKQCSEDKHSCLTPRKKKKNQYRYGYFYPETVWELPTPVKPEPLIHHWIHICMRDIWSENAIMLCVIDPDMFLNVDRMFLELPPLLHKLVWEGVGVILWNYYFKWTFNANISPNKWLPAASLFTVLFSLL